MSLYATSERIRDHLIQQRCQANGVSTDGLQAACKYRAGPLTCAVGCLIEDQLYHADMEGRGVLGAPKVREALRASGIDVEEPKSQGAVPTVGTMLALLWDWQRYHDGEEYSGWCKGIPVRESPEQAHKRLMRMHCVAG